MAEACDKDGRERASRETTILLLAAVQSGRGTRSTLATDGGYVVSSRDPLRFFSGWGPCTRHVCQTEQSQGGIVAHRKRLPVTDPCTPQGRGTQRP